MNSVSNSIIYPNPRIVRFVSLSLAASWLVIVLLIGVFAFREITGSHYLDALIAPLGFLILILVVLSLFVGSTARCPECRCLLFKQVKSDLSMSAWRPIFLSKWSLVVINIVRVRPFNCPNCNQEYTLK